MNGENVCPKCGCTHFTPVRRKWSFVTGYMTNKIDLVCNNCGYVMHTNSSDNSSLDLISKIFLIGLALVLIFAPILIVLDALTGFPVLTEAIEEQEFDMLFFYFLIIIEILILISIAARKIYITAKNNNSEKEKSFFSRHVNIIIGIIILAEVIGLMYVPKMIKKFNNNNVENAGTLSEKDDITTKNLDTYLAVMGKTEEEARETVVDQSFIDGLQDVEIVGYKGSIAHSYTERYEDIISITEWKSNDFLTEKDFSDFLYAFSAYYNQNFIETERYVVIAPKCFCAQDEIHNCHVVTWFESGHICIRWYRQDCLDGIDLYGQ